MGVIATVTVTRNCHRNPEYLATTLTTLDLPAGAFELAAQFCDMREVQLRSGDALHLAVASLGGHSLATLDRTMAEAAVAVGVGVVTV